MVHIAEIGNVVLTERVDTLRRADGTAILAVALAGILEFNDAGQITAWREYWRGGVGGDRSATRDLPWAARSGIREGCSGGPVADRDGPADEGRLWPGVAAAASL